MKRSVMAVCLTGCGMLIACGGSDSDSSADGLIEESFTVIDCQIRLRHPPSSDIGDGVWEEVVDDAHHFVDVYLSMKPNSQDEIPEIDFNQQHVVALSPGIIHNYGPELIVERIAGDDAMLRIEYGLTSPCIVGDAYSYPYCLVAIDATDREPEFVRRDLLGDCE